jgi:hypothetical protein
MPSTDGVFMFFALLGPECLLLRRWEMMKRP